MAASKTSAHLQILPQKSWITRRMVDLFNQHNWSVSCTLFCGQLGYFRTHGNGFGCGISRKEKRPRPCLYQQVPSKTKALHHALRPALWSISIHLVRGGCVPIPTMAVQQVQQRGGSHCFGRHANMVPHWILQACSAPHQWHLRLARALAS